MAVATALTEAEVAAIDEAVDTIGDEAREFVSEILGERIKSTQDNYGKVMALLSKLPSTMAPLFLIAMVRAGYPQRTALQLVGIMGWPSIVAALIEREAK